MKSLPMALILAAMSIEFSVLAHAAVERSRCDDPSNLERIKKMFPDRTVTLATQRMEPPSLFAPNARIECTGDAGPSSISSYQEEVGEIEGHRYRISYLSGGTNVTYHGTTKIAWKGSCSVDAISDHITCFVGPFLSLVLITSYPEKLPIVSIGGEHRYPGVS